MRACLTQMTYPEFLEGIARVAMLKWEDATFPAKGKIERAIKAVVSVLHPDEVTPGGHQS